MKKTKLTGTLSAVLAVALMSTMSAPAIAGFQGLGFLPGGLASKANGISADGLVVVGSDNAALGQEAFRWTADGGMVGLGDLPGGYFVSTAMAVSGDGSVVVGSGAIAGGNQAFHTGVGGLVGIEGTAADGSFSSSANAVASDAMVLAGTSLISPGGGPYTAIAFIASVNSMDPDHTNHSENPHGMSTLGDLPGGMFYSTARGISADGSRVVGGSNSDSGLEAFLWTAGSGMVGLGDLPGGFFRSEANAISGDGSVVVGMGLGAPGNEAFRWTEEDGMVGLGDLPGGNVYSNAKAVSTDGSVIVGDSSAPGGNEAFLWTAAGGMRSLQDMLTTDFGFDLTGWKLDVATGISADGKTIVGWGHGPAGREESWIATIPEPTTVMLLAFGSLALLKRRG